MSIDRDDLISLALKQLQSARTSIESAEIFLDAAVDAEQREPDPERDPSAAPQWPASFGAAAAASGMIGVNVEPLTRERIRADVRPTRADATGAAHDTNHSHAE